MNKKGFAISTMLYGLIFVTLAVFYLILSIVSYRYQANINHVGSLRSELQNVRDEIIESNGTAKSLKLGDYFYLTPDVATYTVSSSVTGDFYDQTINIAGTSDTNGLRLWRVIDIHEDQSLDAVSEYVSADGVNFIGTIGYQYFVSTLQSIAEQYAKSGYTIGTRMMGYDEQTDIITSSVQTYPPATTTSTPTPTSGIGQEYVGGKGGDTLYLKDYQLVSNVYKSDTTTYGDTGLKAYRVGTTTYANYWLASRYYKWSPRNARAELRFFGRCIDSNGSFCDDSTYILHYANSGSWWGWTALSRDYYIRPIITLKSGIRVIGGTGTKADPYTLK